MKRLFVTCAGSLLGLLLVLPALLIALPLWGFSAPVQAIAARLARRSTPWKGIIEFEPEIGWRQRPNLRTRYADKNGDSCTTRTDSEGWSGAWTVEESEVVVFGDSFAFGFGSDVRDAYYSQARGCRIKSIASPGYNMVQALLWMRRYADRLRGKSVVWFICTENDLAENLKPYTSDSYPTPFLCNRKGTADWEVESGHVRPKVWEQGDTGISNVTLFAYLCTSCAYSDRVYAAARHLIQEAKTLCESQDASLVLLSIPYKKQLEPSGLRQLRGCLRSPEGFDPRYPDKRLAAICNELGVSFVAGAEHLTVADYKPRDGHWNARGNRKVAEIIESHHRETRVRPAARTLGFDIAPQAGHSTVRC
jgi:hypothetical protein